MKKNILEKIEKLYKSEKSEKDYDKLLRELKRIELKNPLPPNMLVLKEE